MLSSLSYFQFIFLFLQLTSSIYLLNFTFSTLFAFILLIGIIIYQIFLFNKVELRQSIIIQSNYTKYLIMVFLILSVYDVNLLMQIEQARTLAGLQKIDQIGLLTKLGVVILPAISFSVYFTDVNKFLKYVILLISFFISSYTSIMILSKMPIVPYVIFFVYLIRIGKVSKIHLVSFGGIILSLLFGIYSLRDTSGNIFEIINMIVTRLVMLNETTHIINWLDNHEVLGLQPIKEYTRLITENVFGYAFSNIGIAPSFLGFFLLIFSYFGIIIALSFIFIIYLLIGLFGSKSIFYRLIYFLWSLELLSFFTDGIPHFYLSTTDGIFFWFLVVISIMLFIIKLYKKKEKFSEL